MRKKIVSILACVSLCLLISASTTLFAETETFPNRSVDVVIPFAPGGGNDISIRILAPEAEKILGQKIVILNKQGGGAVIGQTYATKAKPDGYTMLATTNSYVSNILTVDTAYDMDSITPVMMFGTDAEVLVARKELGAKTLQEFVELSKKNPLVISTSGAGTSHHIASLLLAKATGAQFDYLHPSGGSQAMLQVLGGHSDATMVTYSIAQSGQIDKDKLVILAIATDERTEGLPDVPTFKESGVDLVYGAWRGLSVPVGTPADVVEKLHKAFKHALESDTVKEQFTKQNYVIAYKDPEDFGKVIRSTYDNLSKISDVLFKK